MVPVDDDGTALSQAQLGKVEADNMNGSVDDDGTALSQAPLGKVEADNMNGSG